MKYILALLIPINLISCEKCFNDIKDLYFSMTEHIDYNKDSSFLNFNRFSENEKKIFEYGFLLGTSNSVDNILEIIEIYHPALD